MTRTLSLLFVLTVLLLAGCDDTVDPIADSDRQMTLFATLDMDTDVQYIRVIPIRGTIASVDVDPSRYAVRSTNLTNGEVLDWADTLITYPRGQVGLLFYANTRVQPGHSFLIEATEEGSDLVTSAQTTVPATPAITVEPEEVVETIGISGTNVRGSQTVTYDGLNAEPHLVEIWYRFLASPYAPFVDIPVPLPAIRSYEGGRWSATLNLITDRKNIGDTLNVNSYALMGIGVRITNLDDAFVPPGGVFDPEVLVQPGTMSNVTNGFGFVGAVARFDKEWAWNEESVRILGYRTPEDLFGKAGAQIAAKRIE
ncbi:MAG: DUF4249 family protein [Bacteroidetes bacterium]|nr:DUF4249 family protein [Bacteroidota bacterium]